MIGYIGKSGLFRFRGSSAKWRAFIRSIKRKIRTSKVVMIAEFIKQIVKQLHILGMDDKKEDQNSKNAYKCLVPFSANTPRTDSTSAASVFLTPPSTGRQPNDSIERAIKIPCFPRYHGKIPFNLSLDADELDQEYKFDILKELCVRKMQQTVVSQLLRYLDDLSLFRASNVCRGWRDLIRGVDGIEKARVKDFVARKLKICEEQGKENIGIQKRTRNLAQSILENTPKSPAKVLKPCTDFSPLKFRPCPKCNSPAVINSQESAICEKCNEQFCLQCFRNFDGHNLEACTKSYTSKSAKQRKSRTQVIGSKKSKDRLRRLSKSAKKS